MNFARTLCHQCGRSVKLIRFGADVPAAWLDEHTRPDGSTCPGSHTSVPREARSPMQDARNRALAVLDLLDHSLMRLTEAAADDGDQSDREAAADARFYLDALRAAVADVGKPAVQEADEPC